MGWAQEMGGEVRCGGRGKPQDSYGELLKAGLGSWEQLQEGWGTILGQRLQVQSVQPHSWLPWEEAVRRQIAS